MIQITQATKGDIDSVSKLFDAYRQFYKQESNLSLAKTFIEERVQNKESVIFIARDSNGTDLGFVQLYPSFSSVSAKRNWVLNDLYVDPEARKLGVAKELMNAARNLAQETGAKGLGLQTARDNLPAQKLYESLGYVRDEEFCSYFLNVND